MIRFLTFVFIAFFTGPCFAQDLMCQVNLNSILQSEEKISVFEKSFASFGRLEGFTFKVNSKGNEKYEIEVFDSSGPARSYVEGILNTEKDFLKWTYWSREVLLDARCLLLKKQQP